MTNLIRFGAMALALACFPNLPAASAAQADQVFPSAAATPAVGERMQANSNRSVAVRLMELHRARLFSKYNAGHAKQIQQILAHKYQKDQAFAHDAASGKLPLGDGIVGKLTLKWLGRFCDDEGLRSDTPEFERKLVLALENAAENMARREPLPVARDAMFGPEVTYRYDAADPAIQKYPVDLAKRLKPMTRLPRQDKAAFRSAVREALAGLTYEDDLIDLIVSQSRVDVYKLTDETLLKLKRNGMSPEAVDDVRALVGHDYDDENAFRVALEASAEKATDRNGVTGNMPHMVLDSRGELYQVPAAFVDQFAAEAAIPAPVLALFAGLGKVEYPTRELFNSARAAYVVRAMGMCRDKRRMEKRMSDDQFLGLKPVLPEPLFSNIGTLRNYQLRCGAQEQLNAADWAQEANKILSGKLDRVAVTHTLNRVAAPSKNSSRKTSWETEGCDCGRSERDGVVYGFHPLWAKGETRIDFSRLSRIGLYGRSFDETGALQYPPGMDETGIPRGLIEAAHKYMTKIDWVISRNDWRAWSLESDPAKRDILTRLEGEILRMLEVPLEGRMGKMNALASLGLDPARTIGDGVTIDFKNYPSKDRDIFNEFIKKLAEKMKLQNERLKLNIMLDHQEMLLHQKDNDEEMLQPPAKAGAGKGTYSFTNMAALLADQNPVSDALSTAERKDHYRHDLNVLVLLSEPTTDSKKLLRSGVQGALRGEASQRLMRTLIPVLEYAGDSAQLRDDIIYIADNYRGIGFWTLPLLGQDPGGVDAGESIPSVYTELEKSWQMIAPPTPTEQFLASVVCPNRVGLRWAAWASLLIAICSVLFFLKCAGCNERLDKSVLYAALMGVIVLMPFAFLLCLAVGDPLFSKVRIRMGIISLIGVVVTVTFFARQMRHRFRRENP